MIRLIAFALLLLCCPVKANAQAFSFADIPFLAQGVQAPYVFAPVSSLLQASDYLTRGAGLTGAADSKQGILSFWYKPDSDDMDEQTLFIANYPTSGSQIGVHIYRLGGTSMWIDLYDSSGTRIMGIEATGFSVAAGWTHVLCAWDLATTTCDLYVNGIAQGPAFDINDATIDYTQPNWFVGCKSDASDFNDACVSEFYFNFGEFLDLTDIDNRHKFYNAGEPVDMGPDGSIPTGTAPEVYFREWTGVNAGSGGNFTLTSELTACDAPQGPVPPTPDILWWKCNDGSGTTITADVGPNGSTDASWISGVAGSALDFNGSDDDAGTATAIDYQTSVISVAFWVWFDTTSSTRVLLESSDNFNLYGHTFVVYVDAGVLTCDIRGSTNYRVESVATGGTGQWLHYLVVFDNSTTQGDIKVFLNGSEQSTSVDTDAKDASGNFSEQTLFVGARNRASLFLDGKMDDIRIYSGDKSADVLAIMGDPQ